MEQFLSTIMTARDTYANVLIGILRYAAPIFALILLLRCLKPLLSFRREPEIWGWLCLGDGSKLPITHWENVIGRSKRSDIVIDVPTVSKSHGVLTRYDDGSWTITDSDSSDGILVNGQKTKIWALSPTDVISIGGVEMTLQPISRRQEQRLAELRTKGSSFLDGLCNVLLLTVLQAMCCLAFLLNTENQQTAQTILIGFSGIMGMEWLLLLFYVCIHRTSFEVESMAFFLSTMGMAALTTVAPDEILKQLIAMVLGIVVFLLVGWSLRDLERAKKMRYLAGVAGVGFLIVTLLFGQEYYGAKNWLMIGSFSLQPSELSKVCFIFMGASTMDG